MPLTPDPADRSPADPAPDLPLHRGNASPFLRHKGLYALLRVAALLLALLPLGNILRIIATVGSDNPSADYLLYIGMIDRILDGTYDWRNYYFDTFMCGSHSMAYPFALRLLVIRLTDWDMRAELYVVVLLTLLRLFVLYRLLTPFAPPLVRWLLLPLLSALLFSTSQVDTFTYGDAGLQLSLIHLGFLLGVWALVRAEGRTSGVVGMALAGVLASHSGGGGLAVWPVFLLGMGVLGYRRRGHFSVWSAGALLGFLPYLYYVVVQPNMSGRRTLRLIQPGWFVSAVGWPFANGIGTEFERSSTAFYAGLAALLLLASGLWMLVRLGRKEALRATVPTLLIVMMGFASIGLIGIFRAPISPWYTTPFLCVWIGLLGLTVPVSLTWKAAAPPPGVRQRAASRLAPLWIGGVPLVIVAFYLHANLTFEDKTMLLPYRSFASQSILRNYRAAPTHGTEFIVCDLPQYTIMRNSSGPLEKHRISIFARRQTWTLQGDFALHTVTVRETPPALPVRWCAGPGGPVLPWSDYRRLDLRLHGTNRVSWRLTVPEGAREATLRTAIAPSRQAHAADGGWKLSVSAPDAGEETLAEGALQAASAPWKPLAFPLTRFAGREITLHFASTGDAGEAGVLFRFPHLELDLPQAPRRPDPDEVRPANTARSPEFPRSSTHDLVLNVRQPDLWHLDTPLMAVPHGLRLYPGQAAELRPRLDVPLEQFSHLKIDVKPGEDLNPPALRVFFGMEGPEGVPAFPHITMTLLPSREPEGYSYDLRLLEADPGTRLNTLLFFSVSEGGPLWITRCRLLRRTPEPARL